MLVMCYTNSGDKIPRQNTLKEFDIMNIYEIIHTMKEDYGFDFRVNFGLTRTIVDLHICKIIGNPKEKVTYFMTMLYNKGFEEKRVEEEEETHFSNEDGTILIRISD